MSVMELFKEDVKMIPEVFQIDVITEEVLPQEEGIRWDISYSFL